MKRYLYHVEGEKGYAFGVIEADDREWASIMLERKLKDEFPSFKKDTLSLKRIKGDFVIGIVEEE